MLRIFIGYDSDQPVTFHVLVQSLLENASRPIAITPLVLSQLPCDRERELNQTSDFSFTRFLVPWLCGFKGFALYMDPDFLMRCDVHELLLHADPEASVSVVQHSYQPKETTKFLGKAQTSYDRKNWSSLMLFNCARCLMLVPELINTGSADWLRQLRWAERIGALPSEYNHLVGEHEPHADAKGVHFTQGSPCFLPYADCEFSTEWHETLRASNYCRQRT